MAQHGRQYESDYNHEMSEAETSVSMNQHTGGDVLQFYQRVDALDRKCNELRHSIDSLPDLHARLEQALSERDTLEAQSDLEKHNNDAKQCASSIKDDLKALRIETARLPPGSSTREMQTIRCTQLSNRLMEILGEYRALTNRHDQAVRAKFVRQYRAVNPGASEEEIEEKISNQLGGVFAAELLVSTRVNRAHQTLASAEERQREVEKLVRSITELTDMFKELQELIETQDEMLLNIEETVDDVVIDLDHASSDLSVARDKAKSARKKYWFLFFFFLILIIIIVVVVVVVVRNGSSPTK